MPRRSRSESRCGSHQYSSVWWRSGRQLVRAWADDDEEGEVAEVSAVDDLNEDKPQEMFTFELVYLCPFWGLIDVEEIEAPDLMTAVALATVNSIRDFPLHEVSGPHGVAVKALDEEREPMEARILMERDGGLYEEVVHALNVGMAIELAAMYSGPDAEVRAVQAGWVTQWRVDDPEEILGRPDLPDGWAQAA